MKGSTVIQERTSASVSAKRRERKEAVSLHALQPSMSTPPSASKTAWDSLNRLLPRVQPKLERILGYYQIPPQDAEDLIQDSVLTLLYKWEKIHSAEAWLLATLKRRCLMYWRSRRARLTDAVDAAILELLAEPASPSQEKKDLSRDLERVLEHLPTRCQNLLRLRYGLGYKPAEVADRMGYRASSIRKVASRCLAALTRQLIAVGYFEQGGTEDVLRT